MARSQRRYETNLDYEICKEAILKKYEVSRFIIKTDLGPEKGEKLLTFRLKRYPDNPLQLSPKKLILAIHGVKPHKFLLDLKILKELANSLKHLFSEGINYKFLKETLFHYDLINETENEKAFRELESKRLMLSQKGELQSWQESLWNEINSDQKLQNNFALGLAELKAEFIVRNGVCFMPNESIKLNSSNNGKEYEKLLEMDFDLLLKLGLLD